MKKFVISIIIVLVLFCTAGVFAYVKGQPVKVKTDKSVKKLPDEISDIIYYASLAPNSHNTQPWKVSVNTSSNILKIKLDSNRTLKEVDSTDREAYISVGAFTSNLIRAFKSYGYDTKFNIQDGKDGELVSVSYKKIDNSIKDQSNLDLILKRHTDKSTFLDKDIDNKSINEITNDNVIYFKKGTDEFNYIKTAEVAAMKQQSYNKAKAEEFANWLRFSDKEAISKKDGLPAEQLGLTGIIKSIYYLTTSKESAKGDSYANQSIDTTKKQVDNCSGFLIITGGTSVKELIETGIKLQDTWIDAVKHGISVHPMSQILEEKPYKDEVDSKLQTKSPVQMILRVGYVKDYGSNNNIRRNLQEFVEVNN